MRFAPAIAPGLAAAVAGCALPNPPYDGTTRTTMILGPEPRTFTAFVRPRTAPRDVAIAAARAKAGEACQSQFGTSRVKITAAEDGSFAVPYDWRIDGECVADG